MAIAAEHGFQIHQPVEFAGSEPDRLVRPSKDNVVTIGAAFYAAMRLSTSKYVLFLEKDFKMDTSLSAAEIQSQLLGAAGMLDRGAEIVRLLSRKAQGCGTFKACGHAFRPSRVNNPSGGDRRRNWYSFYCPNHPGSQPFVADCLGSDTAKDADNAAMRGDAVENPTEEGRIPRFRCFTSWDSNWSVNAVLVKRESMLTRQYTGRDGQPVGPIAEIGRSFYQANDGFESYMGFAAQWMSWKVPICISLDGLFIHDEVETGA